jgi:hypothetical protein
MIVKKYVKSKIKQASKNERDNRFKSNVNQYNDTKRIDAMKAIHLMGEENQSQKNTARLMNKSIEWVRGIARDYKIRQKDFDELINNTPLDKVEKSVSKIFDILQE